MFKIGTSLPFHKKLEEKYDFTVLVDMTKMHENLLSCGKRYRDMTGNNVNHPNDFMVRCHGQVLCDMLIPQKAEYPNGGNGK